MTDLEQHVNEPGRDKLVKEVKAKIEALGVTYVYYQFVSVTGRIVWYTNDKDEKKLNFLDEINEFVEGIQKKYEQA